MATQKRLRAAGIGRLPGLLSVYVGQLVPFYRRFGESMRKIDDIYTHDVTLLVYLLAPELFHFVHQPVRVDTSPGTGRAKTWPASSDPDQLQRPALRPWLGRLNVKIAVGVQGHAVVSRLREELVKSNLWAACRKSGCCGVFRMNSVPDATNKTVP